MGRTTIQTAKKRAKGNKKSVAKQTRQEKEHLPSHEGIPSGRNVSEKEFSEMFLFSENNFLSFPSNIVGLAAVCFYLLKLMFVYCPNF